MGSWHAIINWYYSWITGIDAVGIWSYCHGWCSWGKRVVLGLAGLGCLTGASWNMGGHQTRYAIGLASAWGTIIWALLIG